WELAVPGTYRVNKPIIEIKSFAPTCQILKSKQKPRKIKILGADGKEYTYLLKGHEDLRLDERVMQLFGLVNTLLSNDPETSKSELNIARYSVIPLSGNVGLIEWVPKTDTIHSLVIRYRSSKNISLHTEQRLIEEFIGDNDYYTLMVIQKVEVLDYILEHTSGDELKNILWMQSKNSENWLDRRSNYTRSLAAMSMVGYILG